MKSATVGGSMPVSSLSCSVAIDAPPTLDYGWSLLDKALPTNVPITVVNGTRWTFERAAVVKYQRINDANGIYFDLVGLDDTTTANVSGMRLSYTAKTGMFRGTFKLLATNEGITDEGKPPRIKRITVNVIGFVINGKGIGTATCKKPAGGPWAVSVK